MLNKQLANLKKEYGDFDDFYRDAKRKYADSGVDDKLINVNVQLNYKGDKLIEMIDMTRQNNERAERVKAEVVGNRERLLEINTANRDLGSGVANAEADLTFLNNREMQKKWGLVAIIVVLGVLDFIALIRRILSVFR